MRKSLRRAGNGTLLAGLREIFGFALKVGFIGQHAEGVRTGFVVLLGDAQRVEVFADDALAGRGAFDFGNQRDGVRGTPQSAVESARGRGVGEACLEFHQRHFTPTGVHLLALGLQNAVQDAHQAQRFAACEEIPAGLRTRPKRRSPRPVDGVQAHYSSVSHSAVQP
jgi:hypothetical protein